MIIDATSNDLNKIYELGSLINKNFKNNYPQESLFNDYTKILLYKDDVKIKGFIHYEIMYETVNILNIVVSETERRKNIGTLLIDNMLSDLNNKEIENIMLEVNSNNIPAINLYKKFNFEIINTRKKYYNGEDAYIMERRIK